MIHWRYALPFLQNGEDQLWCFIAGERDDGGGGASSGIGLGDLAFRFYFCLDGFLFLLLLEVVFLSGADKVLTFY